MHQMEDRPRPFQSCLISNHQVQINGISVFMVLLSFLLWVAPTDHSWRNARRRHGALRLMLFIHFRKLNLLYNFVAYFCDICRVQARPYAS